MGCDIYAISNDAEFEAAALELFREQAIKCKPYAEYLQLLGCDAQQVTSISKIPHLPIELFKSHKIYCDTTPPEAIFTSSGGVSSHHYMASLAEYEASFTRGFEAFYGDISQWSIYALLPSYLEREGSSLIYMVDKLIERAHGGFYLYDHTKLLSDMRLDPRPKILLGVTYALLDLAESSLVTEPLSDTIVMETGGMKGKREELPRAELHSILCQAFGVEQIHSEFGMAELTSQGYSSGSGIFYTPSWMKIQLRDLADPYDLGSEQGRRGGINIIDLASRSSCAFIESQDMGRIVDNRGGFTIDGRIKGSDIRGCNLLIQ